MKRIEELPINVVKLNKLIAIFMGYTYYPHVEGRQYDAGWKSHPKASMFTKHNIFDRLGRKAYLCRNHNQLNYHQNWEWLMPVIDKICDLDLSDGFYQWEDIDNETRSNFKNFEMDIQRHYSIIWLNLELDPSIQIGGGYSEQYYERIEAAWMAVVDFITWYNKAK